MLDSLQKRDSEGERQRKEESESEVQNQDSQTQNGRVGCINVSAAYVLT